VCRSSGEPGGPRRCSGDTRTNYGRAVHEVDQLEQQERHVIGRTPRSSGNAGVHAALRAAVLRMTDTDPDELDAEVAAAMAQDAEVSAAMAQVCEDCGDIGPGYCVCGRVASTAIAQGPAPTKTTSWGERVCEDCGGIGPGSCVCGLAAAGGSSTRQSSLSAALVGVCFFCDATTDGGAHLTRFGKICCATCWPEMKDVS
jgi:hypothetical protein